MDSIGVLSVEKPGLESTDSSVQPMAAGIVTGVIFCVVILIGALVGWIRYAYKHPASKSGAFDRVSKTCC